MQLINMCCVMFADDGAGINQCTRMLERAFRKRGGTQQAGPEPGPTPSLILLARDVRPATTLAHVSLYAHLLDIPILIIPGRASVELGKAVGIRSVAAAAFLPRCDGESTALSNDNEREWKDTHNEIDSFVRYVASKIPHDNGLNTPERSR